MKVNEYKQNYCAYCSKKRKNWGVIELVAPWGVTSKMLCREHWHVALNCMNFGLIEYEKFKTTKSKRRCK